MYSSGEGRDFLRAADHHRSSNHLPDLPCLITTEEGGKVQLVETNPAHQIRPKPSWVCSFIACVLLHRRDHYIEC